MPAVILAVTATVQVVTTAYLIVASTVLLSCLAAAVGVLIRDLAYELTGEGPYTFLG
jgi:hypothetical protein